MLQDEVWPDSDVRIMDNLVGSLRESNAGSVTTRVADEDGKALVVYSVAAVGEVVVGALVAFDAEMLWAVHDGGEVERLGLADLLDMLSPR